MNFKDAVLNAYNKQYDPSIVSCVENAIDRIPPKFMDMLTDIINLFNLELLIGRATFMLRERELLFDRYIMSFTFDFNSDDSSSRFYITIRIRDAYSYDYLFTESSADPDYLYKTFKRFIDEA